ncbi:long-chain-fatty-acid--CoA ligase [Carboxydothermus hydrogenoformans]|uniref:Long-chain-fatty-acid--CoA ligase n=1 Tax=Carboxydothermus hydrogenoformans (strain ATCC BAA-161 / DSM 6008 / Z-2901) TaxID=246194 RepID=Q3ABP3_CARHZ|nr:long-chain fatty acid--CoA ligase [Carboxydothermus hydrogenoformans]ABB14290.1 long-chain-fatty-acid--CoA ligase [Carboxydothermus hydrogenoformans Z-2901]
MYLHEIFKNNFRPEHPALSFRGRKVTYREMAKIIEKYAVFWQQKGLKPGDKVLLVSGNSPEFVYTYFGVVKAGGIIIPVNMGLAPEEIRYIFGDAQARFVAIQEKIWLTLKERFPLPEEMVIVLNEALTSEIMNLEAKFIEPTYNDVCTILYTSGTTGFPKGAMLTHENLIFDTDSVTRFAEVDENDNYLAVLPLFHSFAWTACLLAPLYTGATCTIEDGFNPREIGKVLVAEKITIFLGVPSMFVYLLEYLPREAFNSVHLAVSGGSSLPPQFFYAFEEKFGVPLVEGYGLTEASPIVTLNPRRGPRIPGSIGKVLPGMEVKIVDENLNELPPGEVGELMVFGKNVMKGYYNKPEETAKVLVNGGLLTGDLGKKDEQGYLYIVDRKKDLIIVSGFNVYPTEVERAILDHPAVREVAVVGVPDGVRGEAVKAFITLKEGYNNLTRKELSEFLRDKLAAYKIPRYVEVLPELPKNATGKIMKKVLRGENTNK